MVTVNIVLLGSTGSIGRQTLNVVRALPRQFRVVALAAGANTELLERQLAEFRPDYYYHSPEAPPLSPPEGCRYLPLEEMAALAGVDRVVLAVAGMAGLKPLLAALRAGQQICLANKESVVTAGSIVNRLAEENNARILPVDSEHSAVWQCLHAEAQPATGIILTASGGPFRGFTREQLQTVTHEQALAHPSWTMGPKVTIDSATLINKGLEVIEAHWLFGMPFECIRVLIHPQSIVHSMVEFADGTLKAQLSWPDMRLPIQYALSFPERLSNPELPRLNWERVKSLDFSPPDYDLFPGLKLAVNAGIKGDTFPAVLCAADEAAVELFLKGKVKFPDIVNLVKGALANHRPVAGPGEEDILAADAWAREEVLSLAGGKA